MPLSIGDQLIGRYHVESCLGQGPLGAVYRAFDPLRDRSCVVKECCLDRLPAAGSAGLVALGVYSAGEAPALTRQQAAERFRRETRLLATVEHPHLPRLLDAFSLGQACYRVMAFVEGSSLAEAPQAPYPQKQVLEWLRPVLEALARCHERGLVHRDVRPAHLVLTPAGSVFLVDFGLVEPGLIARASPLAYHAPELGEADAQADMRSEVYALGATLYFLLTGREPVPARERVRGVSLATLQQVAPGVSRQVDAAVMRALALRPSDRYASLAELAEALQGEPGEVEAVRPGQLALAALQQALAASHWPLVLFDDFDDDVYGWDTGPSEDDLSTGSQEIANGRYRWQVKAFEGLSWWTCPDVAPLGDFCVTVEARQRGGRDGEYGLALRAVGDDHYAFTIRDDGRYAVSVEHQGEVEVLCDWAPTSAIRPGEPNRLGVVARGSHFWLLVNDECVAEFDDDRLAEGQVGLLVGLERAGDAGTFEFDRFDLRAP